MQKREDVNPQLGGIPSSTYFSNPLYEEVSSRTCTPQL